MKLKTTTMLIALLLFLGLGALFGGFVLIISPSGHLFGMPLTLLKNSPFVDFMYPGIILFSVLGMAPVYIAAALIKKRSNKIAERLNCYVDMYWAWTFCIYIAFALMLWIQTEMILLQAVHWSHTLYMVLAIAILFVALLPEVRRSFSNHQEGDLNQ
jgi:cytochrome bd-type quinol oxidase subunit 2